MNYTEQPEEKADHLSGRVLPEVTPLTDSQRGVYMECVSAPNRVMYNIPVCLELPAGTDEERFLSAVGKVIAAHPVLRTTIELRDGVPSMILHDWELAVEEKTVESLADEYEAFVKPFDLEKGPLCRFELCRSPEGLAFLHDIHHVIFDGISSKNFIDEIALAYAGEIIPPEELTMFDLAQAEAKDGGEASEQAKAFFDASLNDIDTDSKPIPDVVEKDAPSGAGHFRVSAAGKFTQEEIDRFVQNLGISRGSFFFGAFGFALARFNGTRSSCFCTAYHGRKEQALKRSIGMFARTLPLAFRFEEDMYTADFLRSVRKQLSGAISNAGISFGSLVADHGISNDVVFLCEGNIASGAPLADGWMHVKPPETRDIQTKLDIMLFTGENGFELLAHYDRSLYSEGLVRALINLFLNTAAGLLRAEKMSDITLTDKDNLKKLDEFNRTETPYGSEKTVVEMFRAQAARTPDNVCVVFGKKRLTYRETDRRTDAMAGFLRSLGFGRGKTAGILIPRCENMVLLSLAVLKAGGAYLPLDPSYPAERLNLMVKDSGAELLIEAAEYRDLITEEFAGTRLFTDELDALPEAAALPGPNKDDAFVMLYTSGSTGVPKGIIFRHSNMTVTAEWVKRYYGLCESSRVTAYASYGFDAHAFDIYPALISGAEVHVIGDDIRLDFNALRAYYNDNGITHSVMTTQVGRQFALMGGLKTLRHLSVAGEKLPAVDPPRDFALYNLYGPTEGSIVTSALRINKKYRDVPIGRPVDNLKAYIVSPDGKLLPPGAVGELWISGSHVTAGYHNRPDKTAEVYGANPFAHDVGYARVYHTGDIVRFMPDGNLQFIGRRDGQVKVRGFRVELSEVEEVIRRFPGIKDAAAAAFDEPSGGKYIAGYVVSDEKVNVDALNDFIRSEKPSYMVPEITMQIDTIPLTQNHKINRRALPAPKRQADIIRLPETELQQKIADIAADILGHNSFGTDTDLFRAGLSSIGTLRLNAALSETFGKAVRLSDLKENGTILALEKLLTAEDIGKATENREVLSDYPITETQMGIFVECSAAPDAMNYNMPVLMKLGAGLEIEKLLAAVKAAINAHPYLKTTLFADQEGNIRARRNDSDEPKAEVLCCDDLPDDSQLVRPFPLLHSPLYRISIYKTNMGNYLFMDFHHIIFDGSSATILIKDIEKAYSGSTLEKETYTGFENALDEEKARSSDRYVKAKKYYDSVFTGCETECLPPKAPESDKAEGGCVKLSCSVSPAEIQKFCMENRFTPNAFFNAAFGFALSRFTESDDVVFTSVYNGRSDPRLASSVTMLVKTLPVLVRTEKNTTIKELVRVTQEQLMDSMANDIFSFAEVSKAYGIRSDIILVYQGNDFDFDLLCGEKAERIELSPDMIKAPISVNIFLRKDGFELCADYRRDLFRRELILKLLSAVDKAAESFIGKEYISEISLLAAEDEKKLAEINNTSREFENLPAQRFFERQAAACPDKPAVICGGKTLTFDELNVFANTIAYALLERAAEKNSVVGIILDRGVEIPASQLGILKAGGAFLCLLPSYPDDRVDFCLRNSGCRTVLTTEKLRQEKKELFSEDKPYQVLTLEEIGSRAQARENPRIDAAPDDLAYCIYTSGSTGVPKGVMIEHHSLVNCAQPADFPYCLYCGEKRGGTALAMSSVSFDMSVFDSLLPLMNGMTVVSATDKEIHDPAAMARLIKENGVDTFSATPSYLTNFLGFEEFREAVKGLHTLVAGAEAFPPTLYTALKGISPEINIINGYGPTECAMTCASKLLKSERGITIGGPGANTAFYTVDRFGNILPPYGCGELIICGECVGRGYVGLPEKTAASFFRLRGLPAYHSGDVVRLNMDGEVEFFGRSDNQVKLRGYRVELDEIEKSICSFEGVRQSKVIVRNNGSEDYLAAFFTAERKIDISTLTEYLKARLNYYMVPDVMAQLDSMPLTPSGKVDKKGLPDIKKVSRKSGRKAAKKSTEQQLCELFGSVLDLEEFYADDNFFEMGGTSLSASRVTMQLMAKGLKVEYQNIFDNPTPEALAEYIDSLSDNKKDDISAAESADDSFEALLRSEYDEQLQFNTLAHADKAVREPLGDVLLTGAVGFLGVHVLKELIDLHEGNILCLVRKGDAPSPVIRLKNMLMYYFDEPYTAEFEGRITVLDADITDTELPNVLAPYSFDTLINCAGCVKHYSADDTLERINVHGVENLIRTARMKNARMIQISTVSIPGAHTEETYKRQIKMHENELFVIDSMDNKYGLSKYHAELKMLEAIKDGMRGKIIRVGNLMGRYSDGEFQLNFNTNAFLNALRGFATIGKCPISHATDPMSFSPVDLTAKVIVTLSGTNDCFTAFHANNRFGFDEMQLIEACNRCGVAIRPVDDKEYYADYYRMLADEKINLRLQGLVTNDRPDLHMVDTDNVFTANVLYRLGFSWPLMEKDYLDKTIVSLLTLDYFEPDDGQEV